MIMDQAKEYERFMKMNNLSVVAEKYQKACYKCSYNKKLHERINIYHKTASKLRLID